MEEEKLKEIQDRYIDLTGALPSSIELRIALCKATNRINTVLAIEDLRQVVINENPLGHKISQLVQFGQLVALGERDSAKIHARAAIKAGASTTELLGVVELALITSGMPAYSLGVEIISEETQPRQ
ncbi:carboxymuconolactone decarboxylase family protein [Acidithrix ferrooxidans]|uniref:Carboxymuconolactone decarboxylase family protein n=1 Tax=Acidithrix ferrooxidans TaxID=1280514 RepID=A0A0D8HFK4_9ACTN|nr:carboxymuconolactone decarboxylase family protein [Acidithrix ferrooxidans]KJF16572.1 carboxymuconolactone decarboxylase family protein [Acidithrix ferrooxidans]